MSELKPCPFCGSSNTTLDYYEISCPQELGTIVVCNDCGASAKSIVDWNTRPIEDVLIAERDQAREMVDWLIAIGDLLLNQGGASEKVLLAEDEWRKLVDAWKAAR